MRLEIMPNPYTSLLGITLPVYTLYISLGLLLSLGALIIINRKLASPMHLTNSFIAGIIGGLILARAGHVLIHIDYFGLHLNEITRFSAGGLDWHGAVIGGMAGFFLMGRFHRLHFNLLIDAFAPGLTLVALASWHGCEASACAYGAEITRMAAYPAWLVREAGDIYGLIAPRYDTWFV
ncbi:MAG TPA: prolipoprotein diacylglyceryl transferase family protein, partial [Phototrophicaceae bacterium]|nr:prolipoprotein diacylglyceryl transferase family protein [Phototrophicaceae bacterium]